MIAISFLKPFAFIDSTFIITIHVLIDWQHGLQLFLIWENILLHIVVDFVESLSLSALSLSSDQGQESTAIVTAICLAILSSFRLYAALGVITASNIMIDGACGLGRRTFITLLVEAVTGNGVFVIPFHLLLPIAMHLLICALKHLHLVYLFFPILDNPVHLDPRTKELLRLDRRARAAALYLPRGTFETFLLLNDLRLVELLLF